MNVAPNKQNIDIDNACCAVSVQVSVNLAVFHRLV